MVGNVSSFVEATLLLLPPDAGGRETAVAPRDGSYRPFARIDEQLTRIRLLEGPARLAPGEEARVVLEIESDATMERGAELRVVEPGERVVGIATILRVCRSAAV
jgi:translation elongation factor EF-Tu-like GTPase